MVDAVFLSTLFSCLCTFAFNVSSTRPTMSWHLRKMCTVLTVIFWWNVVKIGFKEGSYNVHCRFAKGFWSFYFGPDASNCGQECSFGNEINEFFAAKIFFCARTVFIFPNSREMQKKCNLRRFIWFLTRFKIFIKDHNMNRDPFKNALILLF